MKARHSLEQQAKGAIGKNPATSGGSGGCVIPSGVGMGSQVWPPASPLHVHWGSSTTPHTLTVHPKFAPREQNPSRGWQQLLPVAPFHLKDGWASEERRLHGEAALW